MRKKYAILVTSLASLMLIIGSGIYYYFYYYIEPVDNYILIKYTPPQLTKSIWGSMEYTKPEYQCELLPNYPNEEAAIKEQEKKAKEFYIFVSKKYEQELKYPTDDNPRLHKIQVNAIKSLLEQERILVRSTHNRNFNPEEALEMIRKHWGDKSLKEYAKSNNVEVTIYHISKF